MSSNVTVTMRGERELAVRFEEFPQNLRTRLVARIDGFTKELLGRVHTASPNRTGQLISEETEREFSDKPGRIAGYVGVYASGEDPGNDYAKAATLEYGTDKPRRAFERKSALASTLTGTRRRLTGKMSRPVHIEAIRYLRDPAKDMQPEVLAGIQEDISTALTEANS